MKNYIKLGLLALGFATCSMIAFADDENDSNIANLVADDNGMDLNQGNSDQWYYGYLPNYDLCAYYPDMYNCGYSIYAGGYPYVDGWYGGYYGRGFGRHHHHHGKAMSRTHGGHHRR